MKRSRILATVVVALLAALVAPAAASAFQITGGGGTQTQNPYGLWYAGQEACAQDGCHSAIASKPTVHSTMVTDVKTYPSELQPGPGSSLWPLRSVANGITIRPRDVYLQVGDRLGFHEYAALPEASLTSLIPVKDDLPLVDPMEYLIEKDQWVEPNPTFAPGSYSQSCSACHNLGVTRPSNQTYTLANGATQTTSTPSTLSGLSIQCEVCHGSGKNPSGHQPGVPGVVGGTQILKSQVCGQCHETATTPQKNFTGSAFGNPNAYTTDATLSAYITPTTAVESSATFMNYIAHGGTKPKFLPNGDNYSMRHVYYNEWLISEHATPTISEVRVSPDSTKCLRCHSGLGFLYRIDAKSPQGKRIVPTEPTLSEVATADPGISCQVCHTGHIGYAPNGGYDSKRRWADGTEVSCGDCHNWRYEQLNQPLQYETIGGVEHSRPALNAAPDHAIREMVSGGYGGDDGTGGMWGVPPTGEFMNGVTCEDCHMPRTSKEGMPANDDGSPDATRMSHRFHPVLPGDAARWKLRPNGESCYASCHTGEAAGWTRADFQSWIDQKTSEVAAASTEASGALVAISSDLGLAQCSSFEAAQPATGAASAVSPALWQMLQHAAQNYDFVVSDPSKGIHNPDYAVAGLRKALFWAQSAGATVTASIDSLGNGEGMTVTGTLHGTHGVVIDGAQVVLQSSADGGSTWSFVATGTPDGTGAFSIPTGRIVGSKLFRCAFSPDSANTFASAPMSVLVPVTVAALTPGTAADGWIDASSVTASLAVTPGASITYYALSGATAQAQTVYTGPFTITAMGETTITFWSSNADGVEAVQTQLVRMDRDDPILACDAASWYADKAVVHVSASDSGGIQLQYSLDGAPLATSANPWVALTITAPGAHTLLVRATDGAGHVSSKSWSFSVKATPKFALTPSSSSKTVGRGKSLSLGLTLSSGAGARIGGKSVYLQRSSDGKSWRTYAKLTTNASGAASRNVRFASRGTSYWRWYVSSDGRVYSGASARRRVVVR